MNAAGILFVTDNPPQLLLARRSADARDHPGKWSIPGGAIEPGETPEAAARREALEELGFMPHGRVQFLDKVTLDGVTFTTYTLTCQEFEPDLCNEHSEWGWFNVGNLPKNLHPGLAVMLARQKARQDRPPAMDAALRRRIQRSIEKRGGKVLRPVRPNLGLEAEYRRSLYSLIEQMHASVVHWVRAAWRGNPPELAMDAAITVGAAPVGQAGLYAYIDGQVLRAADGQPRRFKTQKAAEKAALEALRRLDEPMLPIIGEPLPSQELNAAIKALSARWIGRINAAAPKLGEYFATAAAERSEKTLRRVLRDGGISVRFQPSPAQLDVLQASVHENVALIRSIPQQYLTQVEGYVMRSVQSGRDLGQLSRDLQHELGVIKRRAALIARDQNNKATAAMTRARQKDLGITQAIWMHSGAGKHPRPKHVKASGTPYDVRKGLPIGDKGQYVFPGEEINCKCVSRSVIPGFA